MSNTPIIYQSFLRTILVIEYAIKEQHILPALILIYSSIDSASFLASKSLSEPVNKRFKNWVSKWMLSTQKLPCNAEELYSARCGVVHTFTADSSLTQYKQIRRIAYSWGSADSNKLQKTLDYGHPGKLVAVQIEDLFESFRIGLADFFESAIKDYDLSKQLEERSNKFFSNIKNEDVDLYLDIKKKYLVVAG